jgi:RNA polymerase sigma-70 factor (ECF subfamily)
VDFGVIERNENRLFRAAVAVLKSRAEAEDVVQDVFLKCFEKKPQFESRGHETAWLLRVTVNMCRSRLRSGWWRLTEPLTESFPVRDERQGEVVEAVLGLPAKYRVVIHLHYYEGYSTREVAEITGRKESTVRQQLTRARRMLGDILEGELA